MVPIVQWFEAVAKVANIRNPMEPLSNILGGGFKYFYFHPYLFGEDSHFDQ